MDDFLHSLRRAKTVTAHWAQIDAWAQKDDGAAVLYKIASALKQTGGQSSIEDWKMTSVFDHIIRILSLGSREGFAEAALELSFFGKERHIAAMLAFAQSRPALAQLFERHADNPRYVEVLACILQERVLREGSVLSEEASRQFYERLKLQNHPLSVLPFSLFPEEERLKGYLPHFQLPGGSCSMPFGPNFNEKEEAQTSVPFSKSDTIRFIEVTTEETANRIGTAVAKWKKESNGLIEARVFEASGHLPPAALSSEVLQSLGLECLKGAKSENIHLRESTLAEVMATLFAAAANGGAYNRGEGGAYGRLAMWHSLSGLAGGGSPDSGIEGSVAVIRACQRWWIFDAASDWFSQVAWDIGIVVLRPGNDAIAILAATDTD